MLLSKNIDSSFYKTDINKRYSLGNQEMYNVKNIWKPFVKKDPDSTNFVVDFT